MTHRVKGVKEAKKEQETMKVEERPKIEEKAKVDIKDQEIEWLKAIIVQAFDSMDRYENQISNMRQHLKDIFKESPMNRQALNQMIKPK